MVDFDRKELGPVQKYMDLVRSHIGRNVGMVNFDGKGLGPVFLVHWTKLLPILIV
jgi:hypothetical protein